MATGIMYHTKYISNLPRSSYYGGRQSVNSNGFGIGLGVGMLLGYRSGFLARPYSNTHGYNTYEDIHRREKYNRRKDGLLECAVANTTVYVKKLINIQGKINLLLLNFRSKLKGKISLTSVP